MESGTLGEIRHRRMLDGLVATETIHAASASAGLHAHARAGFALVLQGGYGERLESNFEVHPPGTLILKPAGEPHANRFDRTGARCLLVEFDPSAAERLDGGEALDRPGVWAAGALAVRAVPALGALRGERPPVAIEEAAVEVLRGTGRLRALARERGRPRWLARVRERLHAAAPDRVRLGDLSALAAVHPAHLADTFRRAYGTSITGYVEQLRLERAVRELAASDDTISRVAVRCGFYDHAHLTRVFRRATGTTPSAYRGAIQS